MNSYNYDWYRNNTNQMFFNGMNYNSNLYNPKEGFEKGLCRCLLVGRQQTGADSYRRVAGY